jgi:hypothetical protein
MKGEIGKQKTEPSKKGVESTTLAIDSLHERSIMCLDFFIVNNEGFRKLMSPYEIVCREVK